MGIKNWFFEEDPNAKAKTVPAKAEPAKPEPKVSKAPEDPEEWKKWKNSGGDEPQDVYTPPLYIPPPTQPDSTAFKKAMDHFDSVMKAENENNHPGNDYYEFVITKDAMSEIPITQQYKASFAGLKAQGLTKDKLIESAGRYVKAIDDELDKFKEQFKQAYSSQIDDKKQLMQSKTDEINKLTDQVSKLTEELKQLNQDIITSKTKLEAGGSAFKEAAQKQKEKIQEEIKNINQYC